MTPAYGPYWLHGPCPAWCDQLHEDHLDGPDRRHMSATTEILLSTEDQTVLGEKPRQLTDYHPTELVIYLDQHVREIGPRVVMDQLPCDRGKLHLLPAEARRVSEALVEMAVLAEEARSGPFDSD
jgi:hypothetical protein